MIAGTPDVDVDEWRAATDYHGYTSSDPVISWWWRALKSFNREEKAKLLGFATGTCNKTPQCTRSLLFRYHKSSVGWVY